jgi:TonB family protein
MKNSVSCCTFSVFLLGLIISHACSAADARQEAFIKAELLERKEAEYPYARTKKSHEGVVNLGVMVSPEGKVYSPLVNFSTHVDFEEPALDAVREYKFNPARLNGMPVDSYYDVRIRFNIDGLDGSVSERFSKFYKTVKKELGKDKPNQKKLERKIESMNETYLMPHYALAHLASVKAQTAVKYGDKHSKLNALQQLLIFEGAVGKNGKLLDDYFLAWTKSAIIKNQLDLGQFQAAFWSYLDLQKTDPKNAQRFDASMIKVKDVLSTGAAFSQELKLDARAYQEVSLSATKFEIQDITGNIEKLTFRCQKGFYEIDYQVGSEYFVLSEWGRCKVQISGSQDTVATLIQYQ